MNRKPTIAVALCTYNGAAFLRDQLASLASQSYLPDELVVCDDLSDDDTWEILERFADNAPFRVELHRNPEQLGPTGNFEKAASLCSSDIIAFCDQDDIWEANKVAAIRQVFAGDEQVGCVLSDASIVDSRGTHQGYTLWDTLGFDAQRQRMFIEGDYRDGLLRRTIAFGAVMAFRAELREYAFPVQLPWGHDNWTAIVAAALSKIRLIRAPLIRYRQHSSQYSSAGGKNGIHKLRMVGQQRRNHDITPNATSFQLLAERLVKYGSRAHDQESFNYLLEEVRHKSAHLERRGALVNRGIERASTILGELINGGYHRYSNGTKSAVRDLIYGAYPTRLG